MQQFKSKRNQVFFSGDVVIKRLPTADAAEAEAVRLRALRAAGVDVPEVFGVHDGEITMAYVRGETVPDYLEHPTEAPDAVAAALCDWFERFWAAVDHACTGEIRGDVNGRNFIITDGRVVGVDFEERAYGSRERDIGRLLAFIHTYDLPGRRVQRRFATLFYRETLERLGLSAPEVLRQYKLERRAMRTRRAGRRATNG